MVALLNLSLLESAEHAAHGPIGLGCENLDATQVAITAIDFYGVPGLEAVVGAYSDFDQLIAGTTTGGEDFAADPRDDRLRIGVGVDAV